MFIPKEISERLNISDLGRLARVSQKLNKFSSEDSCWMHIQINSTPIKTDIKNRTGSYIKLIVIPL